MDREKLYFLIKGSIYLLLIIYDRDLIFRGLSSFYIVFIPSKGFLSLWWLMIEGN